MRPVASSNEEELIAAFMEASSVAEKGPTEELLCSLQDICAKLSRSPANAWDTSNRLDHSEADLEFALGFDLSDESGAQVQITQAAGLEENTGIAYDDTPATPQRVRNLITEARVFIQLSLFDLAEGAISQAIVLFHQSHASDDTNQGFQRDSITGVFRVDDVLMGAVDQILQRAERCDAIAALVVTLTTGESVQFTAIDGKLCFGAIVKGHLHLDEQTREVLGEAGIDPDAPTGDVLAKISSEVSARTLKVCRDLMAHSLLLAADLMIEHGFRLTQEPPVHRPCALRFSPASIKAAVNSQRLSLPRTAAREFFDRFTPQSRLGWLISIDGDNTRPIDVWPQETARLAALGAACTAAPDFVEVARPLGEGLIICWLGCNEDGFWLAAFDGMAVALLRFPAASLGRLMSQLISFTPSTQ